MQPNATPTPAPGSTLGTTPLSRCNPTFLRRLCTMSLLLLMGAALIGCGSNPRTEAGRRNLEQDAAATLTMFRQLDPTIQEFLDDAAGYTVFPDIGKGGAGIGGARGWGVVYENGEIIGHSRMTQLTVGWQLGGQTYSQIVAFEDEEAVNRFKRGQLALAAQASAVAAKSGAAAAADYERGVAVFTATRGGLMFEASIGGQEFTFQPTDE